MFRTRTCICAVALFVALLPVAAQAQNLTKEMAKRHYQNGAIYFDRANYKMALEEFEKAYRLEPAPELLYNMARSHEGLGQLEQAGSRYEAFLAARPKSDLAETINARIKNLRDRLETKKPTPTPTPTPTPEPEPQPIREEALSSSTSKMALAGWSTLGAGAAALVVGGILGGLAMQRSGEYEDAYAQHMDYTEAQEILSQAEGMETGMFVCLGVGGAAAIAGAVLLILDSRQETPAASGDSARIRPTLTGLAVDF